MTTLNTIIEEEREYALAIVKKYEAMPFSQTTFSRIKASLTDHSELDQPIK